MSPRKKTGRKSSGSVPVIDTPQKESNNKVIVMIVLGVVLLGAGYALFSSSSGSGDTGTSLVPAPAGGQPAGPGAQAVPVNPVNVTPVAVTPVPVNPVAPDGVAVTPNPGDSVAVTPVPAVPTDPANPGMVSADPTMTPGGTAVTPPATAMNPDGDPAIPPPEGVPADPSAMPQPVNLAPVTLSTPPLESPMAPDAVWNQLGPGLVSLEITTSEGIRSCQGCFITAQGDIMTCLHPFQKVISAQATLHDGSRLPVDHIRLAFPGHDLLVVHVTPSASGLIRPLAFSSLAAQPGQKVMIPESDGGTTRKVLEGKVLSVRTPAETRIILDHELLSGSWYQVNLPLESWHAGSVVLDPNGNILGMHCMTMSLGNGGGFVTPAAELVPVISSLSTTKPDPLPFAGGVPAIADMTMVISDQTLKQTADDLINTPLAAQKLSNMKAFHIQACSFNAFKAESGFYPFVRLTADGVLRTAGLTILPPDAEFRPGEGILLVVVHTREVRRGSTDGSREVRVELALLSMEEPIPGQRSFQTIWTSEEANLGVLTFQSADSGTFSRKSSDELRKLFSQLRASMVKAQRETESYKTMSPEAVQQLQFSELRERMTERVHSAATPGMLEAYFDEDLRRALSATVTP